MVDWVALVAGIVAGVIVLVTVLGFTGSIRTQPLTGECKFSSWVCNVGKMLGVPNFFLTSNGFIFYFLMPLGAIGTIIYGFLDRIRLFRHPVNVTLSVFIALICVPTQVLTMLAATMLALMGTYAVGAFVVVFVVGVALIVGGTISRVGAEYAPLKHQLQSHIDYLKAKIESVGNDTKKPLDERMAEVEILQRMLNQDQGKLDAIDLKKTVESKK